VRQLTKAGCKKVFREVTSGAKTDRAQLRRLLDQLEAGDAVTVTRLDRLARSTRDLLNTLAAITSKKASFKSPGDTWADTTTSHGRLMLTVLGGLAEFERDLVRARTGEGRARAKAGPSSSAVKPKLTEHQKCEGRSAAAILTASHCARSPAATTFRTARFTARSPAQASRLAAWAAERNVSGFEPLLKKGMGANSLPSSVSASVSQDG
jgi:DNA invertase Pin-like site-specific DNA recombinase